MTINRVLYGVALGTALLCSYALPTSATQIFTSNATVGGTVNGFNSSAGPWTAEIFAVANECLRLDVLTEVNDLEIVAVAPNGTAFRNDDRSSTDHRPLVNVNPTPNSGWYTVSISEFSGAAVQGNFTLNVSRPGLNNTNCQPATG